MQNKNENNYEWDITPDPSLLEDIGAGSFTVAEAVSELVANSFDARVGANPVDVEVILKQQEIWIVDSGVGMDFDTLREAVRLAVKMDAIRGTKTPTRKGMYGLGLKTACASLGRIWGIYTKSAKDEEFHHVEFNLDHWSNRRGESSPSWKVRPTSAPSFPDSPINEQESGTAVYVRELRDPNSFMSGSVGARLSKAYKPHLASGDKISVNGESLLPDEIRFDEKSKTIIDELIGPGKKYHVTGWFGVGQTNNDGSFGLNIYRQGQLVEAWNKDWFRAHLMTSRIVGDVNLDFVPSNFHKKGLDKESVEWKIASEYMKEALLPVKRLSESLSKNKSDPLREVKAYSAFSQDLSFRPGLVQTGDSGANQATETPGKESSEPAKNLDKPAAEIVGNTLIVGKERIGITRKIQALESKSMHWDYMYLEDKSELLVVLNPNSPVYEKVGDLDFLGLMALADVVATFLVEKRGWQFKNARAVRDTWLSQFFDASKTGAGK